MLNSNIHLQNLAHCYIRQHKIWSLLRDINTHAGRDIVLADMGLERIDDDPSEYYIAEHKGLNSSFNLRIKDPQRWLIAQLKHGL